ncbi:hypothetical protein AB2P75_01130 [Escherichia coli]
MSGCDSFGQDCGADMVEDLDGEYVLWDEVLPHLYRYGEYTATPAPVSVPISISDEDFEKALSVLNDTLDDCGDSERGLLLALDKAGIEVRSNASCAAMLQGADVSITHEGKNHHKDKLAMVDHSGDSNNMVEPVTTTYKLPFEQWLSKQTGTIDVECGCVMTEVFFNWLRVAYDAGNSPVIPDGLSTVCAEAYQVVGVMADALGVFGDAAVQKVLDNLSQQKLVHRDVLPFSLPVTPDGWVMVPKQVTPEISNAINVVGQRCTCGNCSQRLWDLLLDATQQGVNRG